MLLSCSSQYNGEREINASSQKQIDRNTQRSKKRNDHFFGSEFSCAHNFFTLNPSTTAVSFNEDIVCIF